MVSGGIDSMVLLNLLAAKREQSPFKLMAVHFNFHLRGAESNRDSAFVKRAAKRLGIGFFSIDAPIPKGSGIQSRARNERLRRTKELAASNRWTHVLLAHHADDQAETVLMRLARGAQSRGLRGMEKSVPLAGRARLIRPLLEIPRSDIESYARDRSIEFVEDSSNRTDAYTRNRIRHHVLPGERKRNAAFDREILSSTRAHRRQHRSDQRAANLFLKRYSKKGEIPVAEYRLLNEGERFLVTEFLLKAHGFDKQLTRPIFAEIQKLIGKPKPVERAYGRAILGVHYGFFSWRQAADIAAFELTLSGPGRYKLPNGDQLILKKMKQSSILSRRGPSKKLFLSPDSFTFPLTLRSIRPGDRFIPFGMSRSKKIQDYFVDRKVARFRRAQAPVLTDGGRILCVVGHEIHDACRLKSRKAACFMVYRG